MEKLIELLNKAKPLKKYKEYWYRGNEIYLITYAEDYGASESRNITLDVISRSFGFIKRLVENDKIDRTYRKDLKYPYYIDDKERDLKGYGKSDLLIMLCSIQDNPVEFLISILK